MVCGMFMTDAVQERVKLAEHVAPESPITEVDDEADHAPAAPEVSALRSMVGVDGTAGGGGSGSGSGERRRGGARAAGGRGRARGRE